MPKLLSSIPLMMGLIVIVSACTDSLSDAAAATSSALQSGEGSGDLAQGPRQGGRRHRTPPDEAYAACESVAVGDACTVTLPDGEALDGTCVEPPAEASETAAFCLPAGLADGRRHHGPPPEEAFAVCDGATAGDACTVALEEGQLDGTCIEPRAESGETRLVCAPPHEPCEDDAE